MIRVSKTLIGMGSGLGLMAFAAMSTSAHDRASDGLCELVLTATSGGTRLEAQVNARAPMTGSYALTVREKGAAGSVNVDQSGDFRAANNERVVLSEIELSTAARRLDAEFTLRTGGKTYLCPMRTVPTTL